MFEPFLSIVTRYMPARRQMMERCETSIKAQTCTDYEWLVLRDDMGRGMVWANAQFDRHRDRVSGRYVLMLDDDDMLASPEAVATLRDAADENPGVIVFRADHAGHGILPRADVWGGSPVYGSISGQDFITRRDYWLDNIAEFRGSHDADFRYMSALWAARPRIVWLDKVIVATQQIGGGR